MDRAALFSFWIWDCGLRIEDKKKVGGKMPPTTAGLDAGATIGANYLLLSRKPTMRPTAAEIRIVWPGF